MHRGHRLHNNQQWYVLELILFLQYQNMQIRFRFSTAGGAKFT